MSCPWTVCQELCLRARCAAHALCASHAGAMDQPLSPHRFCAATPGSTISEYGKYDPRCTRLEFVATDTAKLQAGILRCNADSTQIGAETTLVSFARDMHEKMGKYGQLSRIRALAGYRWTRSACVYQYGGAVPSCPDFLA